MGQQKVSEEKKISKDITDKKNLTDSENTKMGTTVLQAFRLCLLAAGLVLVIAGICNKDYIDVMNKAIRICYECIGIG